MIVTKRLEDTIKDFENKKRRDVQKGEDAKVFTDFSTINTNEKISHFGFDSISSFDEAIRNLKNELNDYNSLLNDLQNEIFSINEKLDLLVKHPEDDITNSIDNFKLKKDEIKERVVSLKNKILKEEKNLSELEFARKEFLKNTRQTYKNDTKNRISLLDEYDQKQKEVKNLEAKIYMGTFNNFDKERLEVLKNSIIPDLEKLLKREKLSDSLKDDRESSKKEDEEREIVDKAYFPPHEGSDLEAEPVKKIGKVSRAKDKLKSILSKRSTKIILGIAGLTGLAAIAIHLAKQGDSSGIDLAHEATKNLADSSSNAHILSGTNAGDVTQIFDSNDLAREGLNPETPLKEYFQNDVLGYVTPSNEKVPIDQLQDLVNAKNNGVDISSVYYGDANGIDGYGTQVQGMDLNDFLNTYSNKMR